MSIRYKTVNILSNFINDKILPQDISRLPWKEFSEYSSFIPHEYIVKFKDYWDLSVLCQNKTINWSSGLFEIFGDKLLNKIECNETMALDSYLKFYRGKTILPKTKEILSLRKDVSISLVEQYPSFFQIENPSTNFKQTKLVGNSLTYVFDQPGCICANPTLYWQYNLDFIRKNVDKIDFWLLSKFGKISIEIIREFKEYFFEYRPCSTSVEKHSDYGHFKKYYFSSGWENILKNDSFKKDGPFFKEFGEIKIKKIPAADSWGSNNTTRGFLFDEELKEIIEYHLNKSQDESNWIKLQDINLNTPVFF